MTNQRDPREAIRRAVEAAGGQARLARMLSRLLARPIYQQHVYHWLRTGRVPAEYVLAIERGTGVRRHELRPDIYPPDEYAPVAARAG